MASGPSACGLRRRCKPSAATTPGKYYHASKDFVGFTDWHVTHMVHAWTGSLRACQPKKDGTLWPCRLNSSGRQPWECVCLLGRSPSNKQDIHVGQAVNGCMQVVVGRALTEDGISPCARFDHGQPDSFMLTAALCNAGCCASQQCCVLAAFLPPAQLRAKCMQL